MTTILYTREGADVTDEAIACTTSRVIDSTTYYVGRIAQVPAASILGSSDPDYGIWTAVSKGGNRFTVIADAVPSDSSGGSPDIVIDVSTGEVFSTISQTVYARYVGHGTYNAGSSSSSSGYMIPLNIPGTMPDGSTTDHITVEPPEDWRITKYNIVVPIQGGQQPSGAITLSLRNATGGGGSAATDTLDLGTGVNESGWTTLSTPFAITTSQAATIRGDGKGAQGIQVLLWHEPA